MEQKLSNLGIEKTLILDEGELILSIAASVGKPVINYIKTGIHDGFIVFLNPQFHRDFMFAWLERNQFIWNRYGQPGSQVNINSEIVKKQKVLLPNIKEQEKISNMILKFEDMITLHKRKIQVLKNQKNLYLNKMFISQQGDVQLRFKGFTEPWEQEKLSNVANIVGGGTPSTKEASYWNGAINWFTPNEIGNNKYVKGSLRKITERGLNNSSAQLLPANKTILFTSRATIGTIAILEEEASTNQGFQSLIVNDFNDVNFLYYKLLTMKKLFLKNSVGSTFLEISGKTMKKIDINIPSKTEQEKIGKLLSSIDKAISLHKNKRDTIQKTQKIYLQNNLKDETYA